VGGTKQQLAYEIERPTSGKLRMKWALEAASECNPMIRLKLG